jgi:hypothetical protein
LKKNPEDKNLLKFSTEGNKLTLNQLLSNFRILANISISSIAVSDESALENGACNTEEDTLHTKLIWYFQKYLDLYSEYFDEIESTSLQPVLDTTHLNMLLQQFHP